jgi:hypothetical protein
LPGSTISVRRFMRCIRCPWGQRRGPTETNLTHRRDGPRRVSIGARECRARRTPHIGPRCGVYGSSAGAAIRRKLVPMAHLLSQLRRKDSKYYAHPCGNYRDPQPGCPFIRCETDGCPPDRQCHHCRGSDTSTA